MLQGVVTPDRKLEIELPDDIPVGAVEVEIRIPEDEKASLEALLSTGAVGTWADRTDIDDSVEYARELRKRAFPKDDV